MIKSRVQPRIQVQTVIILILVLYIFARHWIQFREVGTTQTSLQTQDKTTMKAAVASMASLQAAITTLHESLNASKQTLNPPPVAEVTPGKSESGTGCPTLPPQVIQEAPKPAFHVTTLSADRSFTQIANQVLDWNQYTAKYPDRPSRDAIDKYTELLVPFMEKTPPAPITVHKRPPELAYTVDCNSDPAWWNGPRDRPARIVDLILFAFELDTLEIRLHELDEVVDEFVITESVYTSRLVPKNLFFWKNRRRFDRFLPKIIHGIADDAVLKTHADKMGREKMGDFFWGEDRFRAHVYSTYVEVRGEPSDDTIFIVGDVDEIPSANAIAHFKFCKPKVFPIVLSSTIFRHSYKFTFGSILSPYLADKNWIVGNGCKWKDEHNRHDPHVCATAVHTRGGGAGPLTAKGMCGAHVGHFENDYGDLYKNFAAAEGGSVPDSGIGLELLKNPERAREWRSKGRRSCCVNDVAEVNANICKPDAWFVNYNKQRFPHLF